MAMRFSTTDPMTGNDVKDVETAPFVIEGAGNDALLIFFENELSKHAYLEEYPEMSLVSANSTLIGTRNSTAGSAMKM